MDSKKRAIVLGALLHDIGKVGQRAKAEFVKATHLSDRNDFWRNKICPYNEEGNYHSHQHVLWTYDFFESNFTKELRDHLFGDVTDEFNPQNLASFHHKTEEDSQKIIQQADRIASQEREESEPGLKNDFRTVRLPSIFSKIKLSQEVNKTEARFHELIPLALDSNIFPKMKDELNPPYGRTLEAEYNKLWQGLVNDFAKLKERTSNSTLKFDLFLNELYYILMKYTWCVPSYTQGDADISLFDHSRVTAAIATCLFEAKDEEKRLLLVEGDISGIQGFIYDVASPEEARRGMGKRLRGRSFYLTLLNQTIAEFIVDVLDLYIVNLIWCGGGHFLILAPNTEDNRKKLEGIESEINKWMMKEFRGGLGLIIAATEADAKAFKDFPRLLNDISHELKIKKKKKFLDIIKEEKNRNFDFGDNKKLCAVCGIDFKPKRDESICHFCHRSEEIGSWIPKTTKIAFTKDGVKTDKAVQFYWQTDNKSYNYNWNFLTEGEGPSESMVYALNNTESFMGDSQSVGYGFSFIGKRAPLDNEEIASFDEMIEESEGGQFIGMLRMDVDDLGLILSEGLGKDKSISRVATLSRSMDWFFLGHLNEICTDANTLRIPYIIYSGGDDLFIATTWDKALDTAIRINKEFREYTCQNPEIHISGGLYLCKSKFPIGRAAILAGNELDDVAKAEDKDSYKNALAIFGYKVEWSNLGEIKELGDKIIEAIKRDTISRAFLYGLLEIHETHKTNKIAWYSSFLYHLIRNVDKEDSIFTELANNVPKLFTQIPILISYIALKTRK